MTTADTTAPSPTPSSGKSEATTQSKTSTTLTTLKALEMSKRPKVEIPIEIDGAEHHAALAEAEGGSHYKYDSELTPEKCRKHDVRNMGGRFVCSPCKYKKANTWGSGVICTELYLSRDNCTYRTVINAQQCKKCNKYGKLELDVSKYVDRVLDTFALWRGLREARKPDDPHASKGPHDRERCHGCKKGICNKNDVDLFQSRYRNQKSFGRRWA